MKTESRIAQYLLEISAVKIEPTEPFLWSSGLKAPIYCDNRKIVSYPKIRAEVRDAFCKKLQERYPQVTHIAGVATGAITHGILVAEKLGLPFCYVRPEAKGHGLRNRIEGELTQDAQVVVIEDLVSTGGSSMSAINALREAGATVLGMLAIFTYGFEESENLLDEQGVILDTLTDYRALVMEAKEQDYIKEEHIESLMDWHYSPRTWVSK